MILYYLGIAFSIAMAVVCVRRGQTHPWVWIILFFPGVGGAVYFFSEVLPSQSFRRFSTGRASAREVKHAEAEVRRLDNSEAWANLAQALRSRKKFEDARAAAENAVRRDASNKTALYELGLAQMGLNGWGNAVATLSKLVEADPGYASGDAQYALAVALEKSGNKDDARMRLENLARTSSLPKVLYSLAALQAEAGKKAEARESLERIIDESEYVPSYHRRQVRPWVRKARKALTAL